jgi:L-2-hydroxyglutarate oxidase LhgO
VQVTTNPDVVIIGGGIIGLSLARVLLDADPSRRVRVLEKESTLAAHASGRNSGVLHAGFYYAPDSLKARLTRRGNVLLHEFCKEHGVQVRRCGKVVVAQSAEELASLHELKRRADANDVPVELVDEKDLVKLEPLARTHGTALWSPTTSVASPAGVVSAMAADVTARGGTVSTGSQVVAGGPGWVRTPTETIRPGHVVNAAGLFADRVGRWFGMCDDYAMLPFKGLYWYARWQPGRLKRHVYPVPDSRNPFLGVHLTVTVDGRAKIGPTALPALWRESYGGWKGFSFADAASITALYPRFLRSPHHDVPGLLRSELPKHLRRQLVRAAERLVPSLDAADFTERGRPGIRAQLLHLPTRRLEMDFVVRGDAHSTHILNAVSPAWTSSLAVAEHVVDGMRARGVC